MSRKIRLLNVVITSLLPFLTALVLEGGTSASNRFSAVSAGS
jgi:hypothetical protein